MQPNGTRSIRFAMLAVAMAIAAAPAAVAQDARMRVVTMPYEDCTAIIAEAAQDLDTQPVTLTDTADLTLVRIDAADGAVTVSCRRSDNRMVLSRALLFADKTAPPESPR